MTGEMAWINPDGLDSNGDEWPLHAELARRLGGQLVAFDDEIGLSITRDDTREIMSIFENDDLIESVARELLNLET